MILDKMKEKLESALSKKRFIHSVNVMKISLKLAKEHGEDPEKATVAGLLHDCARDIRGDSLLQCCEKYQIEIDELTATQPELLHGQLGTFIAEEEYGITDGYILKAIRYHTTGCTNMSLLDKIVFIADTIEPNRSFPGVEELRKLAFSNLDEAVKASLDRTIKYIIGKGSLIHQDTIAARNYIILNSKKQVHGGR